MDRVYQSNKETGETTGHRTAWEGQYEDNGVRRPGETTELEIKYSTAGIFPGIPLN
tara:strand:+ start:23183 stop:23350 length:168 start_codon:yes stop_codon:yes gene_type:complete